MFKILFGKDSLKIESLEDLQDERARGIAIQNSLDVREILPRYLELTKEVLASGGQIEIDMNNPTTPLNVPEGYRKN
jgi:hypothetical protein